VRGEVESERKVLVIRRIHVTYHLTTRLDQKETVDRVYAVHANFCPVYRSLAAAIEITTELDWSPQETG
jgi:uncharacterized OsmC-like protein